MSTNFTIEFVHEAGLVHGVASVSLVELAKVRTVLPGHHIKHKTILGLLVLYMWRRWLSKSIAFHKAENKDFSS